MTTGVTGAPPRAIATRVLTCGDGTGSATALVLNVDAEHGGTGGWTIISGTGQHAKLRGKGTFVSVQTGGDPQDHGTVTFRSNWTGIADLDDLAPVIAITKASAAKLRRPKGSYLVRVAFSANDNGGGPVGYVIAVSSGFTRVSGKGETASGTASRALRFRPAKTVRSLRLEITAADTWGNESKISRTVRLPARRS